MKFLPRLLLALAILPAEARAQAPTMAPIQGVVPGQGLPPMSMFGPDPIMRITVSFRTAVATAETQGMSDAKAAEVVRRTLYSMAANECTVLAEMFKAECRLNSMVMTSVVGTINPSGVMSATAIYEVKVTGQTGGR